jgi:hypothetical protein
MPKLVLMGPQLVVQGALEKQGERSWELTVHEWLDHDSADVEEAVRKFNALSAQERFIAFGHEAHRVNDLLVTTDTSVPQQFPFQAAPALARVHCGEVLGGATQGASPSKPWFEPGPYLEEVLSMALSEGRMWQRLEAVVSRQSVSSSWFHMLNNLLRLEVTRLAALPVTKAGLRSERTTLQCVEYVHNVVALSNLPDEPFELGVVLDIRGYGPWAGVVSLTRKQDVPLNRGPAEG